MFFTNGIYKLKILPSTDSTWEAETLHLKWVNLGIRWSDWPMIKNLQIKFYWNLGYNDNKIN